MNPITPESSQSMDIVEIGRLFDVAQRTLAFRERALYGSGCVIEGFSPELLEGILTSYRDAQQICEISDEQFAQLLKKAEEQGAIAVLGKTPPSHKEGGWVTGMTDWIKSRLDMMIVVGGMSLLGGEMASGAETELNPKAAISGDLVAGSTQLGPENVLLARHRHRHRDRGRTVIRNQTNIYNPPPQGYYNPQYPGQYVQVNPQQQYLPSLPYNSYAPQVQPYQWSNSYSYWYQNPAQPDPRVEEYRRQMEEQRRQLEEERRKQEALRQELNRRVIENNTKIGFPPRPGEQEADYNRRIKEHNARAGMPFAPGDNVDAYNARIRAYNAELARAKEANKVKVEEHLRKLEGEGYKVRRYPDGSFDAYRPVGPKPHSPEQERQLQEGGDVWRRMQEERRKLIDRLKRQGIYDGSSLPQDDKSLFLASDLKVLLSAGYDVVVYAASNDVAQDVRDALREAGFKEKPQDNQGVPALDSSLAQGGEPTQGQVLGQASSQRDTGTGKA